VLSPVIRIYCGSSPLAREILPHTRSIGTMTASSQVVHPLVHTVVLFHTATMLQPTRLSLDTPKEFRFRNGFSTRQGHRSSRTSLIVSCRKGAREGGGTRSGVSLPWHDLYTQVLGRRMLSCKGGTPHRLLITPLYHGSDHIRTNQPSIYRSKLRNKTPNLTDPRSFTREPRSRLRSYSQVHLSNE
jgi:hypothetical protein